MCTYSMVMDHFQPIIPHLQPEPVLIHPLPATQWPWTPNLDVQELKKLLADFKEALSAAVTLDKALGHPDCEDPEKAKLVDRVAELEAAIAGLDVPREPLTHRIMLAKKFCVEATLPRDLTKSEALRLSRWLDALAVDDAVPRPTSAQAVKP